MMVVRSVTRSDRCARGRMRSLTQKRGSGSQICGLDGPTLASPVEPLEAFREMRSAPALAAVAVVRVGGAGGAGAGAGAVAVAAGDRVGPVANHFVHPACSAALPALVPYCRHAVRPVIQR